MAEGYSGQRCVYKDDDGHQCMRQSLDMTYPYCAACEVKVRERSVPVRMGTGMDEAKRVEQEAIKALTTDQYERASAILQKVVAADQLDEIWEQMRLRPKDWWAPFHFGWGMWVRNQLRVAGFRDNESKSGNLDDIYIPLVEYTVKKTRKGEVSNEVLIATAAKYLRRLHDIPARAQASLDKLMAELDKLMREEKKE